MIYYQNKDQFGFDRRPKSADAEFIRSHERVSYDPELGDRSTEPKEPKLQSGGEGSGPAKAEGKRSRKRRPAEGVTTVPTGDVL